MSQTVADIAVSLRADISPFQRGMDGAGRSVQRFESRNRAMAATLMQVGRVAATAAAAIAAAGGAIAVSAARSAQEIANLSRISATSTTEFQRMAAAVQTVEMSQEKLADVLRDVQDRVGDFLATGGGPMADFFENIAPQIGVTADMFARLSGPEALQLYVSSLERANLTQSEMVFYLEAMASDSSDLLPLLRDNGRAMQELGDQAQRAGRVLSEDAVRSGERLNRTFENLSSTITGALHNAFLANADDIINVAETVEQNLAPALAGIVPVAIQVAGEIAEIVGVVAALIERAQQLQNLLPSGIFNPRGLIDDLSEVGDRFTSWRDGLPRNPGQTGGIPLTTNNPNYLLPPAPIFSPNPAGTPISAQPGFMSPPPGAFALPGVTFDGSGAGLSGSSGGGGGGGGGSDLRERLEAMQSQFATEQEVIQANYERQMEMLREFRENQVGTEEEYNELQRQIQAEHNQQMQQQEQAAMQARLSIISGALGDIAGFIEATGNRNLAAVRALRTAEAVIEGYSAAVAAWRQGMSIGGPGLAAVYTAGSLARTGALIAQMQNSGKGSTGGASGGGGTSAPIARPTQNVLIDMVNASPSQISGIQNLVDMLTEANRQGYDLNTIVRAS